MDLKDKYMHYVKNRIYYYYYFLKIVHFTQQAFFGVGYRIRCFIFTQFYSRLCHVALLSSPCRQANLNHRIIEFIPFTLLSGTCRGGCMHVC